MKLRNIFLFFVITGFFFGSCSKSSDPTPSVVDYGANASGMYTGNVFDTVVATVKITKQTTATVAMHVEIPITGIVLDYPGVTASDGGNGKVLLTLTTGPTPINGSVNGKSLDCNFNLLHFIGTKP